LVDVLKSVLATFWPMVRGHQALRCGIVVLGPAVAIACPRRPSPVGRGLGCGLAIASSDRRCCLLCLALSHHFDGAEQGRGPAWFSAFRSCRRPPRLLTVSKRRACPSAHRGMGAGPGRSGDWTPLSLPLYLASQRRRDRSNSSTARLAIRSPRPCSGACCCRLVLVLS
jgi:hypothetical protein